MISKKILTNQIYAVIGIHTMLLVVDRFPWWISLLSIASHGVYYLNLRRFPIVKLSDPVFITSCGMSIQHMHFAS